MRSIPSIEQLRQRTGMQALEPRYGRGAVTDALRAAAGSVRQQLASGAALDDVTAAIEADAVARLQVMAAPSLRHVINATGVILHTNLGWAPLARAAAARAASLGTGYTNLEYDLAAGRRGRRDLHAEKLLCRLTGAAAAVVVNNNAAATLIALAALAAGREVIISRGELVEIGGGFRVPDVMAQSGAILREVGTTNRTRAADYAAAIGDRTAAILRVHPSNFRIQGFTERPRLGDIVALARRFSLPVIEDLGSGWFGAPDDSAQVPADEPIVRTSLRDGADLVMFSGDKLMGGPQAGILAGTQAAIALVRGHPLMRALRVDKLTYAALEATLEEYAAGRAAKTLPVARMLRLTRDDIAPRAEALARGLAGSAYEVSVVDGMSTVGGGSAPGAELPTRLVALAQGTRPAEGILGALRTADPPVIARIEDERVVIDLRTVSPDEEPDLLRALLRD
ncbi:L-seryl-tRNA(Sec) selenium transferase [soil metagenome]